jgi:hypothetical protein
MLLFTLSPLLLVKLFRLVVASSQSLVCTVLCSGAEVLITCHRRVKVH